MKEYRICNNCVMDTSDPDIKFDENGICNYCIEYPKKRKMFVPEPHEREKYLNKMIEVCKKKGKGKKYDCIIGVSGGVDSTYLAWKVKEFGLRPLAVHLDNGWDSELAVANIHKVLKQLDIELYTYVLDWEEFKSLQIAFLKSSTPDCEIPTDHAIVALLRQLASKYDLPLILGVNFSSEAILPRAWSQGHMDWHYIKKVNKLFGNKKLKNYPHYSIFKLIYWKRIKSIPEFYLLNYIEYVKEDAKKFLIEKFDWQDYGSKHHESIYTKFYQNYILPTKFGFDKRRAHYSSLILAKQMTRDEALIKLKEPLYSEEELKEHLEYIPKKLGLTREEFDAIMRKPQKSYFDYAPKWTSRIKFLDKKIYAIIKKLKDL